MESSCNLKENCILARSIVHIDGAETPADSDVFADFLFAEGDEERSGDFYITPASPTTVPNCPRPPSTGSQKSPRPRRQRTTSMTQSSKKTSAESLIHSHTRTIYTAGRPPWYNCAGQQVEPFVIGICGGSASGKTTVAAKIIESLNVPWVTLLSMDSFYKVLNEKQHESAERNEYNFDHPDAFDFELLTLTLQRLKEGKKVEVPIYNFVTHSRESRTKIMYGANVIIFEGILTFYHPEVSKMLDMKIFVDTDADVRLVRRLRRDISQRGRDLEGVLKQYSTMVQPAFNYYIAPGMAHADIIVPRGGDNEVAIELIVQHVHTQLQLRGFKLREKLANSYTGQPLPDSFHLLPTTPQIRGLHTFIRNRDTPRDEFIFYSKRLIRLVIEYTLSLLPFSELTVETPQGVNYQGKRSASSKICGVSILRAGETMEQAVCDVCKDIRIGKILIQTNFITGEPETAVNYYNVKHGTHLVSLLVFCLWFILCYRCVFTAIMFYLNNLCSLCLAQNKKLTSRSSIDSNAEEMLQRIIPEFAQQTSEIQRKFCDDCLGSLIAVFEFRQKCLENLITYDEYVRKLQEYGSYNCLEVTIVDIKLDIKKEIKDEIILNEDTCFHLNDSRTNFLEVDVNVKQENSYNRESNEEQEEKDQRSNVVLDIKKEINEEVILDEDICFVEDGLRTDFLKVEDYTEQNNSYSKSNKEQDEDYQESDDTLSTFYESDFENPDESENQDIDCEVFFQCTNCGEESSYRMRDTDPPKCHKCHTIFSDTNTTNDSEQSHSTKKPYSCHSCQRTFRFFSALRQHELVHDNKSYSCGLCRKRFTQFRYVKLHQQRVHSVKKQFVCEICRKSFANAYSLKRHNLTHSDNSDKGSFECDICQRWFQTANYLKRHKQIHEGKRYKSAHIQNRSENSAVVQIDPGKKPFQCDLCKKTFMRSGSLNLHMREIHSDTKSYECKICNKIFTSARYFQQHKLLHSEERPLKCNICEKTFVSSTGLMLHKRIHNNEETFLCTICKKVYFTLSSLNRHKTVHTGERPFSCEVCPKKFRLAGDLRVHKRIHDGIRPFQCGICGKSFHVKSNLKKHEKSHHKENFERAEDEESVISVT